MDYSLLLMKVSWGDYLKEHPSAEKNMVYLKLMIIFR
jgi:hypothetical protein